MCQEFCPKGRGVGILACIAGGIPACLAAGLQRGGGIPACLAGFQAHTQGGSLGGSGQRGVSRPTPKGEVEGDLAGGGPLGPHPRGKLRGNWPRGVSRPIPRGSALGGDLLLGGCLVPGCLCVWRPPPRMATAAGGTHPTGMHSC